MRIGIFGGTFDPPHVGHLVLAEEARFQLSLDKILWVLTSNPPHKKNQTVTPVEVRLVLLEAALSGNEKFEISRVDIDRPTPHYAVDTVRLLKAQFPSDTLVYLMGSDSLHDLPSWYKPDVLVDLVDEIGVMCRPNADVERHQDLTKAQSELIGLAEKVRFIKTAQLEIASSDIRCMVREQGAFRYYLHPAVYDLVYQRGLYLD